MRVEQLRPQRYESVAPEDVLSWLLDDRWVAEQKLDGVRCLVKVANGQHRLHASTGYEMTRYSALWWTTLDASFQPLVESTIDTGIEWALDGELMEDGTLWLFDAPVTSQTGPSDPFSKRREALVAIGELLGWTESSQVRIVPQAVGCDAKKELWETVLGTNKEGICLKRLAGPYKTVPGGRTRDVLKVKRTYTVDCVVTATRVGNKDSGEIAVYRDGRLIPIGKCTMTESDASVGDVVEVRFLYVNDLDKPRLFQPILMRQRTDKLPEDCTFDQLVYATVSRSVLA